jgi:hypothetical protein
MWSTAVQCRNFSTLLPRPTEAPQLGKFASSKQQAPTTPTPTTKHPPLASPCSPGALCARHGHLPAAFLPPSLRRAPPPPRPSRHAHDPPSSRSPRKLRCTGPESPSPPRSPCAMRRRRLRSLLLAPPRLHRPNSHGTTSSHSAGRAGGLGRRARVSVPSA